MLRVLFLFALFFSPRVFACDFCMLGQGLNPYLTATGRGMTLDSTYTSSNAVYNHDSTVDSEGKKESWLIYSLTGFYPVTEDLTLLLTIPFASKTNVDFDDNIQTGAAVQGIGDISFTGRYTFSRIHSLENTWLNGLLLGIKAPTGYTNFRGPDGKVLDRHVQTGTGSFDYNLGLSSSFASSKGYQLTADFLYTFAGAGKWGGNDHRYGDSVNASVKAFYKVTPVEKVENSVYVFTGPAFESTGKEHGVYSSLGNYNSDEINESTGGIVLFWNFGVYMPITPQTIFNFSFAKAFYHDMNLSDSYDSDPAEDYKINMSVSFLF